MIKVFVSPSYYGTAPDRGNGGIKRVSEAMLKHLPTFGIEVVHKPDQAHIIANHGGMQTQSPGVPLVNINHGLYWSRQPWGAGFIDVNKTVIDSMKMSIAHTAPSEWVNVAIRRGGLFFPTTVNHGVDYEDFSKSKEPGNFVLYNKFRSDFVSDEKDMQRVANLMPKTDFVSTLGVEARNVKLVGTMPYADMKQLVSKAGVYLSTARETFGIGTLEAMACGVPVAGFNWGGNCSIIKQGYTGYLAQPGDYKALAECIKMCFADRETLSKNCMSDVENNWTWEPRIEQYAEIFKRVYADHYENNRPKVSVIITAYKLDRFLSKCLESVSKQTFNDFECLVIDDALMDSTKKIVAAYRKKDKRIKYKRPPNNLGLSGARNFGLTQAKGQYIRHLDADDWLDRQALGIEVNALDKDPSIHVVYGHLEVVNEDGSRNKNKSGKVIRSGWPSEKFDWFAQMSHMNQLPSCSMARREVYEKSGGYRIRVDRNEDADFWCRVSSLGFNIQKVTEKVLYYHRQRESSKGAVEWKEKGGEIDWTAFFPWRIGPKDHRDAVRKLKAKSSHPAPHLVPFSAQGKSRSIRHWYVHDYQYPVVSIIVTCGPGHEKYLVDALDSIQAQSYPDWECIVVNDTGKKWDKDIMGAPWAKVINTNGNKGASFARNAGLPYISHGSSFVVWLDADDIWLPWFLDRMVAYGELNNGVIFSDLIKDDGDKLEKYEYPEFDQTIVAKSMRYPGSSVLIPRHIVNAMWDFQKCWDLDIPGMEDWDFQIAIHHLGFCAYRIDEPLFVYRLMTSTKRETDYARIEDIRAYIDKKWHGYRTGEKEMACGCGGKKKSTSKPASTMSSSGNFSKLSASAEDIPETRMVAVQYVGPKKEPFSIKSKVDRQVLYRFANDHIHSVRNVFRGDIDFLLSFSDNLGNPTYRVIGSDRSMDGQNPANALGQAVQ